MVDLPAKVPKEVMLNARKVLYMTHLAIGDYVYQGTFLQKLCEQYPHIELDVWFDDCRTKEKSWHEGRNSALTQWLSQEPHIKEIYPNVGSDEARQKLVNKASQQGYDVIVFIASQRSELYAKFSRKISDTAFIVGSKATSWTNIFDKWWRFSKLDGWFSIANREEKDLNLPIRRIYKKRFTQCFGPIFDRDMPDSHPLVPSQAHIDAARQQISAAAQAQVTDYSDIIVINHLSTSPKRDWSWIKVIQFISAFSEQSPSSFFVINTPPDAYEETLKLANDNEKLRGIPFLVFTAEKDFRMLPAMIHISDLVISVETAIMHLASAQHVPLIAMMRESAVAWRPPHVHKTLFAVNTVNDISAEQVLTAVSDFFIAIRNSENSSEMSNKTK